MNVIHEQSLLCQTARNFMFALNVDVECTVRFDFTAITVNRVSEFGSSSPNLFLVESNSGFW